MSDHDNRCRCAAATIENGRRTTDEIPLNEIALLEDDLEQVAAAGSNSIALGQETN